MPRLAPASSRLAPAGPPPRRAAVGRYRSQMNSQIDPLPLRAGPVIREAINWEGERGRTAAELEAELEALRRTISEP